MLAVLSGILWNLFGRDHFNREVVEITGELAIASLPSKDAPKIEQREAIIALGRRINTSVSLFDERLNPIASYGRPVRSPSDSRARRGRGGRSGPHLTLALPDGRWLVINVTRPGSPHPLVNLILFLGTIAVSVVIASYPLVRRLTRRLERLQEGVEQMGSGELSTRVKVEGRDEVAGLAQSFNDAAEKIERLVDTNRMLLANASHELRTPLARIRLGIEMLEKKEDPKRREALKRDIDELDILIDEILLMSRLEAGAQLNRSGLVDLVGLAAEESVYFEHCSVEGSAPDIYGDPHLLRRLIRNLLKNATEHGEPPVFVDVEAKDNMVILTVSDTGRGIAEDEREKVFDPFYRASQSATKDGYGLGLALVRQIAEAHGGTATVTTEGKRRSAIRVTLPISPGK